MTNQDNCPDCGTGFGQPIQNECDVERCSTCGSQRVSLDGDEKPDVIITDDPKFGEGRKKLLSWPDFAAELLSQLQEEFPELKQVTLEQFIRHSPFQFEIVE